jgi:hypothetical protein
MKITAYNQHDVGSSHEPWSCSSHTNLLAAMGQRRYVIKQAFFCAVRNLGEPRVASRFLRRNNHAFGELPHHAAPPPGNDTGFLDAGFRMLISM